jgi:hypothetical protein
MASDNWSDFSAAFRLKRGRSEAMNDEIWNQVRMETAREMRTSADDIERALRTMFDLFSELAAALPNASEGARLLRVVGGARESSVRIVTALRTNAAKLEEA